MPDDPAPFPVPKQTIFNPAQSFEAVGGDARPFGAPVDFEQEVKAKWRADTTFFQKVWAMSNAKDPTFSKWSGLEGYEEFADELLTADSQAEQDGLKAIIDQRRYDSTTALNGTGGIWADLAAGAMSPMNLIPVPAVKGIGFLRGIAAYGALNAFQTGVGEAARQWSDPTATWQESVENIGIGALLGGALGGPVGGYGAAQHARALRSFERGLGYVDGPTVSMPLHGFDEGVNIVRERPPLGANGEYRKQAVVDELDGYEAKEDGGYSWVWQDGPGWVRLADLNHPNPRGADPQTAARLGTPEARMRQTYYADDARLNRDHAEGGWHDELRDYLAEGDETPIESVVRDRKDYVNFRDRQFMWERKLTPNEGETADAFRIRAGRQAMDEFRGSRVSTNYAGGFFGWVTEQANLSPLAKAIKLTKGDPVIGYRVLRMGGDSGWAIKANEFGFPTPPSVYMSGLRHTVEFEKFRQALDAEWVRFASGNQQTTGKIFQNANVTAQLLALKAGLRKRAGQTVLDYGTFNEMVSLAVIHGDAPFSHKGFEVNDNIRAAAKARVRLMEQYDRLNYEHGIYKNQKNLAYDIRKYTRDKMFYQDRVNRWLWGQRGTPENYLSSVRAVWDGELRIFSGESHEEAIANMIDELGDDGYMLSEMLTERDYGYTNRHGPESTTATPPPAAGKTRFYYGSSDPAHDVRSQDELWVTPHIDYARHYRMGSTENTLWYVDIDDADLVNLGLRDDINNYNTNAKLSQEWAQKAERLIEDEAVTPDTPLDFTSIDDMTQGRVAALSPRQLEIYMDISTAYHMAAEALDEARKTLEIISASPHRFVNAAGEPENYFTRNWDNAKIATRRDGLEFLLARWFERDGNPLGADARAAESVNNILKDQAGSTGSRAAGASHLNQRLLNVPNSFRAIHPVYGEIGITDFIDLNALATAQHYVHSSAMRIEAAKMFGDHELKGERMRVRQHLLDTLYEPQTTDEGRAAAMARILEIEGQANLVDQAVFGGMKDRDPWAIDNQIARDMTGLTSLAMMGKTAITSMVDVMRIPMVHGFGTFFSMVFRRLADDMAEHGEDMRMGGLTNEVFELAQTQFNMQQHNYEAGYADVKGNAFSQWIANRQPGFFKLNGLSSLTVFLKTLTADCAQHVVMEDAVRIADIVNRGEQLSKRDSMRLAALGIDARGAVLLASMPFERWKDGKLILPAAHKWGGGADADRARRLLLDAIHREMRRTINTPSIGDRSTVFNGVFTHRGKKVFESDLMKIPMQFMAYGVGANNKVLASALQGRDRATMMGAFMMVAMGYMVNYWKMDSSTYRAKEYDDLMFEAIQTAGLGGFWFGDLNSMIERVSNERYGIRPNLIRPLTGTEPRKRTGYSDIDALVGALGAGPGAMANIVTTFLDPDKGASDYASVLRRHAPYNNILWWHRFLRDTTGDLASTFEGARQ